MRVVVTKGGGWTYAELPVELGQIIELRGFRGDPNLLKHGYVMEIEGKIEERHCDGCGKDFSEDAYNNHRRRARHDLEPIEVSSPQLKQPAAPVKLDRDPDKLSEDWPLEPEGTPPVPKLEEERPGGTRIKMGGG